MTTNELIARLRKRDPSGQKTVYIEEADGFRREVGSIFDIKTGCPCLSTDFARDEEDE